MEHFSIQLTNFPGFLFPGQFVEGQVLVATSKPVKARKVEVLLRGKAHVYFRQPRYVNQRR